MFRSRTALWFRAREISDQLALRLRLPPPMVEIGKASESGYQPNLILVGKMYQALEETFLVETLVHEMAHHLARERYFRLGVRDRIARRRDAPDDLQSGASSHGEVYCQALAEVARAWYGEPQNHNWAREHTPVYAWAVTQGYAHQI